MISLSVLNKEVFKMNVVWWPGEIDLRRNDENKKKQQQKKKFSLCQAK